MLLADLFIIMDRPKAGKCFVCKASCWLECSECYCVLTLLADLFIIMDMPKAGKCFVCKALCWLECSKCYCVRTYLGQKHNCPNPDEGIAVSLCSKCEKKYNSKPLAIIKAFLVDSNTTTALFRATTMNLD